MRKNAVYRFEIIFLLTAILLMTLFPGQAEASNHHFAAEETVCVDLIYRENLRFGEIQNFIDVTGLMPGDYFKRTVQINPDCKAAVNLQLNYIKSREANAFIRQLNAKVYYDDKVVYNGPCDLTKPISLGKVKKSSRSVGFEIYFPKESGNKYQNKSGKIWISFTAKADDKEVASDGDQKPGKVPAGNPVTGDLSKTMIYFILLTGSCLCIFKSRTEKNRSE